MLLRVSWETFLFQSVHNIFRHIIMLDTLSHCALTEKHTRRFFYFFDRAYWLPFKSFLSLLDLPKCQAMPDPFGGGGDIQRGGFRWSWHFQIYGMRVGKEIIKYKSMSASTYNENVFFVFMKNSHPCRDVCEHSNKNLCHLCQQLRALNNKPCSLLFQIDNM